MASKPGRREVLVESDFLFGLRKGDKHQEGVSKALSMHRKGNLGISILSSAAVEVRTTLYSRGLRFHEVEDALAFIDAILSDADVRSYVPLRLSDVVLAERLRSQFAELTFFDSLHAAASKRVGVPLLSGDTIYRKVGVNALVYEEL